MGSEFRKEGRKEGRGSEGKVGGLSEYQEDEARGAAGKGEEGAKMCETIMLTKTILTR